MTMSQSSVVCGDEFGQIKCRPLIHLSVFRLKSYLMTK